MAWTDVATTVACLAVIGIAGAYSVVLEVNTRAMEVAPASLLHTTVYFLDVHGSIDVTPSGSIVDINLGGSLPPLGEPMAYELMLHRTDGNKVSLGPPASQNSIHQEVDEDLSDVESLTLGVGPSTGPFQTLATVRANAGQFGGGPTRVQLRDAVAIPSRMTAWSPQPGRLDFYGQLRDLTPLGGLEYRLWAREDAIDQLERVPRVFNEGFDVAAEDADAPRPPRRDLYYDEYRSDYFPPQGSIDAIQRMIAPGPAVRFHLLSRSVGTEEGSNLLVDTWFSRTTDSVATFRFVTLSSPGTQLEQPSGYVALVDPIWL